MTYDPLQAGEVLAGIYAAKIYNPKQNLLVDTSKHSPILRCDENIEGLLKPHDRAAVQHVVQAFNERCLAVYLGGGVVGNALRGKPRQYKDIDLLVVGEPIPCRNIMRALDDTNARQAHGIPGSIFDYPGRTFDVEHNIRTHEGSVIEPIEMYFNLSGVRRYAIMPSGKATPIDVAITSLDMFELQRVREL